MSPSSLCGDRWNTCGPRANQHASCDQTKSAACYETAVPLPKELVDILVCPKSKAPLLYFPRGEKNDDEAAGFLVCPASRLRYRIDNGVPVMLVEEAAELPADAVERLVSRARELGIPAR